MRKEEDIIITKGVKNNRLVFVLQVKDIGKILITPSIPENILPYLEFSSKNRNK